MDANDAVNRVQWNCTVEKIRAAINDPGYRDRTGDFQAPVASDLVGNIKMIRADFNDDDLFKAIAAGAGFMEMVQTWKQERVEKMVNDMSVAVHGEISKIDQTISMPDCRRFLLETILQAIV
jgi:hypothetical protein